MSYYSQAFRMALEDVKEPECWYVCLISSYQAYGGPEEGGWWYSVQTLEAYQEFVSKELAENAANHVKGLAADLEKAATKRHGERCLSEMEWLDARMLEDDFLPQPDGSEKYRVVVVDELPTFDNRRPQWS